jgi:hypothetical protein
MKRMLRLFCDDSLAESSRRQARGLLLIAVGFLLCARGAMAQLTSADVLGTVTDSSGAELPGATVTLENLATHATRTTLSGASGNYIFGLLPPAHYSIKVESVGFKTYTIPDLGVEAGDRARADATMAIGQTSQTVEVVAQTPLLQADSATVSNTVTDRAVQDLPLNGRNFVQLVQLVPGANEGPGNGLTSGGRPDDRRPTNGFSINGQDDTLNNEVIDGLDNNERIIGTIGVKPSVDAIQEISVETNNYAPEIGRTAGGVVNIITKSGTNAFHGSVYEFFRNDDLDARNAFSRIGEVPKAELRQNQFGGSIGGPIRRDKTFFFGDYEGLRLISGGTTYTSTVPTVAQYNDIHSLNGGSPQALVAQGNGTQGYPIDPISLNYLMLFPLPNAGGANAIANNYIINPSKTQYSTTVDARVDHRFNETNTLYGRFTFNDVSTYTPAQLPAAANGIIAGGGRYNFSGPALDKATAYQLNYTHIFTSELLLQLNAGYTRINNSSLPLNYGTNADTKVGFGPNMNFNATSSGLTPISINGFPDLGDGAYVPLIDLDGTYMYMGNVSYTRGAHNIKVGAGLIRRQARNVQSAFPFGQYTFQLSTDGNSNPAIAQTNALASALVGGFTSDNRQYDLTPPDYRSWEPSFYAQDYWKITPKLTITYGARYDVFTPFTEAHNHIANFDFNSALAATPSTIGSSLQVASVNGVSSTAGIKTDYSNFAPRLGFAATVGQGLVVRGGFGLSFFPGNYTSNADLKNAPFTSVYNPNCESTVAYQIQARLAPGNIANIAPPCAAGQNTFADGLPIPAPQNINSSSLSFEAENPNLRQGIVEQFNLLVEKQLGQNVITVGYVAALGRHLPETINDINEPPPNATGLNRPLNTLLPNLSSVAWYESEGSSSYNGLQTSFQRRYNKGLTLDFNYTYSHALSDITGLSEEGQEGWSDADPFHISQIEHGNADNDIRHRIVAQSTYQLPFGHNYSGMKKALFGGWQVNEIFAWQTGKPFTIINSASDGGYNNRAHPGPINGGVDRPSQIHSAHLAHPTNQEWFDTSAFVPQPLGTVGNTARNSLYGPHFRHLDVSLFKDFAIRERLTLQLRSEFFNVTNTPSFFINNNVNSSPPTQLGNSSFGQITATDPNYSPRQIQFAAKLVF